MLEPRETPALVSWLPGVGGAWNDPTAWTGGQLPTALDDVSINLNPGQTIVVPVGVNAAVHSVTANARLDVFGNLTVTAPSAVFGELDVESSGAVTSAIPDAVPSAAPGDELSLLPYLGTPNALALFGGDVAGQLNTLAGSQTTLMSGELRLAGAGALTGDGWYSINAATLSLNGANATINNLYAGPCSTVGGNADLTTTALIAYNATFDGPATAKLINNGFGYIYAPAPDPGKTHINRSKEVEAGKTEEIKGNLELSRGAVFTNNGTVNVTESVTISSGVGGGQATNKSKWNVSGEEFRADVPFNNTGTLVTKIGEQSAETLKFVDYHQYVEGIASPILKMEGTTVQVGSAIIEGGYVYGKLGTGPFGTLWVDSELAPDNQGRLVLGQREGVDAMELWGVAITADNSSTVVIQAAVNPAAREDGLGLIFQDGSVSLNGTTTWLSGKLSAHGTQFTNTGTFEVKTGGEFSGSKALGGQVEAAFTNSGTFTRSDPEQSEDLLFGLIFINVAPGSLALTVGHTEFDSPFNIAGTVTMGEDAQLAFTSTKISAYSAATTLQPGSKLWFDAGTTRFVANTTFSGAGWVVLRGSTWELTPRVTVNVSNARIEGNPETGKLFSSIIGQVVPNDPTCPLPRLVVNSYISLESFATDTLFLLVTSTAIGNLAPLGKAEFSTSILKIEGWVFWEDGDVTLSNNSTIAVGNAPGAPMAVFAICTNATMWMGNQPGNSSRVIVYGNGWAGRFWTAPPGFTTFQVPMAPDGNDPGTVDLTGIVFI